MSHDIYQQKIDQILEDCDRAIGVSDDVCIYGKTIEEHDRRLRKTMDTAQKYGLVFNKEKCKIRQKQIKFYGLIWDENGSHPDPEKCDKIKSKPIPANREELQQFLGMIQYLSPFIPKLSSKTAPLRTLFKKDIDYQWNETFNKVFQSLKDHIHVNICLAYFKPNAKTIQVDASMSGLGATLINDNKIVAFDSKRLTDTESRYTNIERELLAVVFGCERFHTYIYGKEFQIESDHKPLENIQNKNIAQAPPRLQRMLLRLQPYNAQMLCYIDTYVDSHLHTCTYICRIIHSDTMIKTQEGKRSDNDRRRKEDARRLLCKIYTSHFIARVVQGLLVRGCWRPNINFIF